MSILKISKLAFAISGAILSLTWADAAQFGNFTYEVSGQEITITSFPSDIEGHVDVPSEIEGKPVTVIEGAFMFSSIESINIPASVKKLGDNTFAAAFNLSSVTMADSVTEIGVSCFYQTHGLSTLRLSNNLESIGESAFLLSSGLTSIEIPDSVKTIHSRAFHDCSNLATVTLGSGVESIGDLAFRSCSSLTSIVIPDNVTQLGNLAFGNCHGLTSITLGNGVTTFENSEFYDSRSLLSIEFPEGTTVIGSGFSGCSSLTSIKFPESLVAIGEWGLTGCDSLVSVTLPSSVNSLGERAFSQCANLQSVILPASLETVGTRAFAFSENLSSILFLGSAPATFPDLLDDLNTFAPNFSLYFFEDQTGFTNPTWHGYPTTMIATEDAPFAPWLLTHNLPHDSNLSDDLNQNGFTLLLAYALNLNPKQNLEGQLPQAVIELGLLKMSFFGARTEVTYTVEQSENLQDWSTTGVTMTSPDSEGLRTAEISADTPTRFLRIAVELN